MQFECGLGFEADSWVSLGWLTRAGRIIHRSFCIIYLHPSSPVEVSKDDGAIAQGEPDKKQVERPCGQHRRHPHAFEGIIERAKQEAPYLGMLSHDDFFISIKGPCCSYYHSAIPFLNSAQLYFCRHG